MFGILKRHHRRKPNLKSIDNQECYTWSEQNPHKERKMAKEYIKRDDLLHIRELCRGP
jgi:hypothetical protein